MAFPTPTIETQRLVLTWPTADQTDGYYRDIIGSNIFDTILWNGPENPEELHSFWAVNRRRDPADYGLDLSLAVIEKSTGRYIGGVGLRPVNGNAAQIDLGYAFAPQAHGQGYATEAVGALVDDAFRHRGAERVFGGVFVGNFASRRVMEKNGFQLEGVHRRVVLKRGEWIDEWVLAITRPDWEASVQTSSSEKPTGDHS